MFLLDFASICGTKHIVSKICSTEICVAVPGSNSALYRWVGKDGILLLTAAFSLDLSLLLRAP